MPSGVRARRKRRSARTPALGTMRSARKKGCQGPRCDRRGGRGRGRRLGGGEVEGVPVQVAAGRIDGAQQGVAARRPGLRRRPERELVRQPLRLPARIPGRLAVNGPAEGEEVGESLRDPRIGGLCGQLNRRRLAAGDGDRRGVESLAVGHAAGCEGAEAHAVARAVACHAPTTHRRLPGPRRYPRRASAGSARRCLPSQARDLIRVGSESRLRRSRPLVLLCHKH